MAVEEQQGGDAYFHFAGQPNDDTLVSDIRKVRRIKRAFVEHALRPTGEQRQSDSIRGSVFPGKSQAGKIGGTGRIVTELFKNDMLEYVQGILNGDPEVLSEYVDLGLAVVANEPNILFQTADTVTAANGDVVLSVGTDSGDDVTLTSDEDDPTQNAFGALDGTPSRLTITVESATGSLIVKGKRRYGLGERDLTTVEETIDLDDTTNSATTDGYFAEIDQLTLEADDNSTPPDGLTSGDDYDLDIVAEPGLRTTTFKARSAVHDGFTFQSLIGNESRLGLTGVISNATFNVSDTIRLTMDMLFRAVYRRRTIEGGVFDEVLNDDSDLVDDAFGASEFFVDYGGYLLFDGNVVIFDDFSLTFNPGLQYRTGKNGERIQSGIERGDAGASIEGSITVNFETGDDPDDEFIRWDERYRDSDLSEVEIFAYFWDNTGKQYYHRIKMPNVELTADSETPVTSRGTIKENLSIRAVVEGSDDVIEWEILDDNGWFGVTPTMEFDTALATAGGGGNVTIDFGRDIPVGSDPDAGEVDNTDLADELTVDGATKGAVSGSGSTRTLALTASEAGPLSVTLAKNGVPQGNAATTESITVV